MRMRMRKTADELLGPISDRSEIVLNTSLGSLCALIDSAISRRYPGSDVDVRWAEDPAAAHPTLVTDDAGRSRPDIARACDALIEEARRREGWIWTIWDQWEQDEWLE